MGKITPLVTLITHTPEPEKVVACAAKLCYSQKSGKVLDYDMTLEEVKEFLGKLPSTHGTPMEHATFTFSIEGVSRSCSHQLVRHRLANYNQRSQRYVDEGDFNYIIPEAFEQYDLSSEFEACMSNAKDAYDMLKNALINQGVPVKIAQENARAVLPNACETKLMVTMNARELHHFFNQRCCSRAQDEIREVANQMLDICKRTAPLLFRGAGPFCITSPCPEGSMSCGQQSEMRERYGDE